MPLKLYYNFLSQPSRALYIFFKKAGIAFEPCPVDLAKGEHLTEDFKKTFNKFQKVPFIHHDNFKLPESIAILRYAAREFAVEDHWYPKDSKKQAEADVYLEWQHLNIRLFCALFFQLKWLIPRMTKGKPNEEHVHFIKEKMINCLEEFQDCFLSDAKFICGDQISYADIAAACEIEQTRIAGYDVRDHFPVIKNWIEEVRRQCNPYYDEAHALLYRISNKSGNESKAKL